MTLIAARRTTAPVYRAAKVVISELVTLQFGVFELDISKLVARIPAVVVNLLVLEAGILVLSEGAVAA